MIVFFHDFIDSFLSSFLIFLTADNADAEKACEYGKEDSDAGPGERLIDISASCGSIDGCAVLIGVGGSV